MGIFYDSLIICKLMDSSKKSAKGGSAAAVLKNNKSRGVFSGLLTSKKSVIQKDLSLPAPLKSLP
jgi:hypothetical protein